MNNPIEVFILLRMRYWKLAQEPEVFMNFEEAREAFEEFTRTDWDDFQSLVEEAGGDPDEILGGPFAGTSLLMVEIRCPHPERAAAA
jgi:hypothetical protein